MWIQAAQAVSEEVTTIGALSHVGTMVFLAILGISKLVELGKEFGFIHPRKSDAANGTNGSYRQTLTLSELRMKEIVSAVVHPIGDKEVLLLEDIKKLMSELVEHQRANSLAHKVAEEINKAKRTNA